MNDPAHTEIWLFASFREQLRLEDPFLCKPRNRRVFAAKAAAGSIAAAVAVDPEAEAWRPGREDECFVPCCGRLVKAFLFRCRSRCETFIPVRELSSRRLEQRASHLHMNPFQVLYSVHNMCGKIQQRAMPAYALGVLAKIAAG